MPHGQPSKPLVRCVLVHDEKFKIWNGVWDTSHVVRVRNYASPSYDTGDPNGKPSMTLITSLIECNFGEESASIGMGWYIRACRYARALMAPTEPSRYIVLYKIRGGLFQFELTFGIRTSRILYDPTIKPLTPLTMDWIVSRRSRGIA